MPAPLAALVALTVTAAADPYDRHDRDDHYERHERRQHEAPVEVVVDDPVQSLANARAELAEIRSLLIHADSRRDQRRVERRLARLDLMLSGTERSLSVWDRSLRRVGWQYVPHQPPPEVWTFEPEPEPVEVVYAIEDADLERLLDLMDDAAFSEEKLAYVQDAVQHHWFTASQARRVIAAQTFGDDKVAAGVMLHEVCIDPENWLVVYGAFDFQSYAHSLRKRLAAR